jgi:hypothetical protein
MMESRYAEQEYNFLMAGGENTDGLDKSIIDSKCKRAIEVLDEGLENIPEHLVPYDAYMVQYSQLYYELGEIDKAYELDQRIAKYLVSELNWYMSLDNEKQQEARQMIEQNVMMLRRMVQTAKQNDKDASEWEAAISGIK